MIEIIFKKMINFISKTNMSVCPICIEELETDKNYIVLECGHEYHLKCLLKYKNTRTETKKTCGICRANSKIFKPNIEVKLLEIQLSAMRVDYRETVIATEAMLYAEMCYVDRVHILKTLIDKYKQMMKFHTDVENEEEEEQLDSNQILDSLTVAQLERITEIIND